MPKPLPLVAIPTRHRAGDVRELLQSLDAAVEPAAAPAEVLVVDDSDDDRASATGEAAFARFARLRVEYVSLRRRREWTLSKAKTAGLDETLCLSLLAPSTRIATNVGAARNFALLRAKGRAVLFLDDDVRSKVVATGNPTTTSFMGYEEPVETQCFERFVDAAATLAARARDLRTLHAAVLGAAVATPDGAKQVRLVMLGYAGRSGTGSPAFYLLTKGPVRQQLARDAGAYELILATNLVLRGAPCVVHASPAALVMGGCLSVDCRVVVPPFLPTGRNQDGFFGGLFAQIHPQALMTHLPFAVQHGTVRAQIGMPSLGRSNVRAFALGGQFASVFLAFLPSLQLNDTEPDARLRAIAMQFTAFENLPNATFEDRLRDVWSSRFANWARSFDAAAARLPAGFSAQEDAAYLAAELRAKAGNLPSVDDAPAPDLRDALTRTGQQLQVWADLWADLKTN